MAAIARSDGTRASVLRELRESEANDGILGSFRFDANGDMTHGHDPDPAHHRRDPAGRGPPARSSRARSSTASCRCRRASSE